MRTIIVFSCVAALLFSMTSNAATNCAQKNRIPNWHFKNRLNIPTKGQCTVSAHCGQYTVNKKFDANNGTCVVPRKLTILQNDVRCTTVRVTHRDDVTAIVNSLADAVANSCQIY